MRLSKNSLNKIIKLFFFTKSVYKKYFVFHIKVNNITKMPSSGNKVQSPVGAIGSTNPSANCPREVFLEKYFQMLSNFTYDQAKERAVSILMNISFCPNVIILIV